MKTQLTVTVTQKGDEPTAPAQLEREVRDLLRATYASDYCTVTVRHVVEDTDPAADTLEALVREYGNSPVAGKGRVRADVMTDIRALMAAMPDTGTQPADVEQAVATLNEVAARDGDAQVSVGRRQLQNTLVDAHRAGQMTGRLLPKEGRERATAFAEQALAVLVK